MKSPNVAYLCADPVLLFLPRHYPVEPANSTFPPPPPPVPTCWCSQVPCVLDPPCTYLPTLNITLPAGVSSAFLRDHLMPGHPRRGLSHDDPRVLDPPCTYSPTLNVTLPAGASSAFLRDHPEPGHARSGLSHDVLPPLRP